MTIKFNNYSMWVGEKSGADWYDWCVFVDENAEVLSTIKSVEYTLHPTFPNPVRVIEDRSNYFALFSSGWGYFSIRIRTTFTDGSTSLTSYVLRLARNDWPKKPAPRIFANSETEVVYRALLNEKYRWRTIEALVKNTRLSKDTVSHILGKLQKESYARKAPFLSIDNKELWGATSVVGLAPGHAENR